MGNFGFPFLVLFIHVVFGVDYFVDENGDDTKDGKSIPNAWKTISKVNSVIGDLLPGDKVLFSCGSVWAGEFLRINDLKGEMGKEITFSSYGSGQLPIIDPSVPIPDFWEGAPEVGVGVYKINNSKIGFDPAEIVHYENGVTKRVAGIWRTYMGDGSGFGWLSTPPEAYANYSKGDVKFWDGLEAQWGTSTDGIYTFGGTTYFRSRNYEHPNTFDLRASSNYQRSIYVTHSEHLKFQNFLLRGCRYPFYVLYGNFIEISNSTIMNGGKRIYLEFCNDVTISNNDLYLSYYGYDEFGSDKLNDPYGSLVRMHVYSTFKYHIGSSSSDDTGISIRYGGSRTVIKNNVIHDGLVGFSFYDTEAVSGIRIHDNLFANFVSIGLTLTQNLRDIHIFRNRFFNSAINLRVHHLNADTDKRLAYIYDNVFWNPGAVSSHHFFHWYDGPINPDTPVIYMRHNSYSAALRALYVSSLVLSIKKLDRTYFENNIYSSYEYMYAGTEVIHATEKIFGSFENNLCAGNYHHGVPSGNSWFGKSNVQQQGIFLWVPLEIKPNFRIQRKPPITF